MSRTTVRELEKEVRDLQEWKKGVDKDMKELNNFMLIQKYQNQNSNVKDKDGNIRWVELGKQALVFLTVCASVVLIMVQFILERSK